jgi:hypothetical protein
MKILVDSEVEKVQLLAASRHLHDLREIDTNMPMVNALAHLHQAPHLIEVLPADWRTPEVVALAKAIYAQYPGADQHPWVEGGNSDKQTEALYEARKRLKV